MKIWSFLHFFGDLKKDVLKAKTLDNSLHIDFLVLKTRRKYKK
jgi:hypothetical protein